MLFVTGQSAQQAHRSLLASVQAMEQAEHNAVLWFAEILVRKLYRELGYGSIQQYATVELGFSRTRTCDFVRLATKLDQLPAIKQSVASGELGYTKAREIVKVATPRTEQRWVEAARTTGRRELEQKVARVRRQAQRRRSQNPAQAELLATSPPPEAGANRNAPIDAPGMGTPDSTPGAGTPDSTPGADTPDSTPGADTPDSTPGADLPDSVPDTDRLDETALAAEVPVRISIEMTPEQFARYEALLEQVRKQGATSADRAELLLEALAALAEPRQSSNRSGNRSGNRPAPTTGCHEASCADPFPRGNASPFQVHVLRCPECGRTTVPTSRGELPLGPAETVRSQCDAVIQTPGGRNQATIPPRIRREVLARDRHRCRAPGCTHTRFLEVHHVKPRAAGGGNEPENLITLCSACHRIWHERVVAMGR